MVRLRILPPWMPTIADMVRAEAPAEALPEAPAEATMLQVEALLAGRMAAEVLGAAEAMVEVLRAAVVGQVPEDWMVQP